MTKTRYKRTFKLFEMEDQAKEFCENQNKNSYYIRKHHRATYTNWVSQDETEHKYISWYSTK